MAVWLAVLAYALPPVILVLQRLRAPRDLASRQRVAQTVLTFLAVPVSWAGVSFLSNALLTRAGPTGVGGLALALLAPALLLLLVVLTTQRVPWARLWPLGLVPILLLFGVARLGGSHVVEPGSIRTLLAAATLLVAAAVAGPAAAGALARSTAPRVGFAVVTGALLLVPASYGILMPLIGFTEGGLGSPATQSWTVDFQPESDEPYVLTVPFFVVENTSRSPGSAESVLARLRDDLHVASGDAAFALVDGGRAIEVRGQGPVRLEARLSFHGPGSESFLRYRVPEGAAFALAEGSPPGRVAVAMDFSGGTGHTCWARAGFEAALAPGAPVEPRAASDRISDDGRIAALCA